jgi:hypothetical protein
MWEDVGALVEMASEEPQSEVPLMEEAVDTLKRLSRTLEEWELMQMLGGRFDR